MPNTRRFAALILASAMMAGAASAQAFTFTSTTDESTNLGTSTAQGTIAGAFWSGTTTTNYVDGGTVESTYQCVSMSQPPRDAIFMMHGVCDGTSEQGDYTVYTGCNLMNEDGTEMGCVGGLIGKSGEYAGRSGSVTIHAKDGASSGTGQWYAADEPAD